MSQDIIIAELAGAELTWPFGTAAGMSNHPDIEVVARNFQGLVALGVGEAVLGSVKLGEVSGGNAHVQQLDGSWLHVGGDEAVEVEKGVGHNSKGLPGPGVDPVIARINDFIDLGRSKDTEVSLSVSPHTKNPLKEVPELLEAARKALLAGVLRVEFNLSCPNIPDRPAFYLDNEAVYDFTEMVAMKQDVLRNRFGHPGIYPKFGPMGRTFDEYRLRNNTLLTASQGVFGGIVTSNTIPGSGVLNKNGENEITVNNGKAGQSGPFFEEYGRNQLAKWQFGTLLPSHHVERVSALGVSNGLEILRRLGEGATFCQLASVVYWPELVGKESAGDVVDMIKGQIVDTVS